MTDKSEFEVVTRSGVFHTHKGKLVDCEYCKIDNLESLLKEAIELINDIAHDDADENNMVCNHYSRLRSYSREFLDKPELKEWL